MFELTEKEDLKEPAFSLEEGFRVTLWRPSAVVNNVADETVHETDQDIIHDTVHDAIHDTIHDTIHDFKTIDDLSHRVVLVITNEMSRREIMEVLELKNRAHFANNYLEPALSLKLIEMTIPDKPKSKNQKYRLTTKGIKLQKQLKA